MEYWKIHSIIHSERLYDYSKNKRRVKSMISNSFLWYLFCDWIFNSFSIRQELFISSISGNVIAFDIGTTVTVNKI